MPSDYQATLRALYALAGRGITPGLERARAALSLIGDPQERLTVVHVAGTNGKGSVCAMLERALRAAGLRTGMYTSPHLHRFTERIRLDGNEIERDEIVLAFDRLQPVLRQVAGLTFFELVTVMAFDIFARRGCEAVVLETGLGGLYDATNVVSRPLVTVITAIARDHERYLGSSIAGIAREKAGILREGVPGVIGARDPEALAAIIEHAHGAELLFLDRELLVERRSDGLRVSMGSRSIEGLSLALRGAYQDQNAALAVAALWLLADRGLPITDPAIRIGVGDARWPGRLESIAGSPAILLDAAHNPQGMTSLVDYLRDRSERPRVLLFGAMSDKDWPAMLASIDVEAKVLVAPTGLTRSERPERLHEVAGGEIAESVAAGLDRAREIAGPDGLVIVAGSIFVMAEARALLLGEASDPPITM